MVDEKILEHGEKFKGMCKEVLPLIVQIEGVLKKHGEENMVNLTADVKTGYFTFSTHGSEWEMIRVNKESPVKIRCNFSEEISVAEEK